MLFRLTINTEHGELSILTGDEGICTGAVDTWKGWIDDDEPEHHTLEIIGVCDSYKRESRTMTVNMQLVVSMDYCQI